MTKNFEFNINLLFFFLATLCAASIIFIIFPKIVYGFFIYPIYEDKRLYLFEDYNQIIAVIKCKSLGIDVYTLNPCDRLGRIHSYGNSFFFIPFYDHLNKFYFIYFPFLTIIFFLLVIAVHFNFKSFKQIFLFLIFLFNPSTVLLVERLNFDIFIFLFTVVICYFRKSLLSLIIILFLTLSKFYPVVLSFIFFLNNKRFRNNLALFIIFFISIFSFGKDYFQVFLDILINKDLLVSADYKFNFSFWALKRIPILSNNFSQNFLMLLSIIFFLLFYFVGILLGMNLVKKNLIFKNFNYFETLYICCCSILILTFFLHHNLYYRLVFIFGLIPLSLQRSRQCKFFNYSINFIILYLLFFSLSNYFSLFLENDFLLIFRYMFDICLVSIISGLFTILGFNLLKSKFQFVY